MYETKIETKRTALETKREHLFVGRTDKRIVGTNGLGNLFPDGEIETAGEQQEECPLLFFFRDFYLFHPDDLPHCPYGRNRHIV